MYAQALDARRIAGTLRRPDSHRRRACSTRRGGGSGAADRRARRSTARTTGSFTKAARSLPRLKQFVEEGGTLIAVGGATSHRRGTRLAGVECARRRTGDRRAAAEAATQYYIPGSVLRVSVDNTTPLGYGFEREVDVFFDNSPVFRIGASARRRHARRVVLQRRAAAQRMGLGAAVSRKRRRGRRCAGRPGPCAAVRPGDHLPRAVARHVQVPVQRDLLREG